ncbi:hypothetical protein Lwor_1701 [Legionella worsleiensis]|uniref:Uncharacterized protein n=1 Tax=Legionella worsleiensis TaxID=45076 RepID=A0A0W1AAD0_9GAMM|nr:hypothetical protein Lwor_1701 [Legionella worsleiensis]STY32643.1 Uncharacterised protein [Legionella worsleiensis]
MSDLKIRFATKNDTNLILQFIKTIRVRSCLLPLYHIMPISTDQRQKKRSDPISRPHIRCFIGIDRLFPRLQAAGLLAVS